jgi:hypothetical protein
MQIVYVAGPFSAPTRSGVEANILAAAKVGVEVAKLGAMPLVPHANTALPEYEQAQLYEFWIEGTARLLLACDAVLLLDNWRESSGAVKEHALACEAGIPCFFSLAGLETWIKAQGETTDGWNEPGPEEIDTDPAPPPSYRLDGPGPEMHFEADGHEIGGEG